MSFYKICLIGDDEEKQRFLKTLGKKHPEHSKEVNGATIDAYSFGHGDTLVVWNVSSDKWRASLIPLMLKEATAVVTAGEVPKHFAEHLKGMTTIQSAGGRDEVFSQLHAIIEAKSAQHRPSNR